MNRLSRITLVGSAVIAAVAIAIGSSSIAQQASNPSKQLRPVSAFDGIKDTRARSIALFGEVGKVLTHPRCSNCHPRTDKPLQGEVGALHQPKVVRGEGGMGAPGMTCDTCHGTENFGNVPGSPAWHLAPAEMAWVGVPLPEICEQIKDPERNGGMDLAALQHHMSEDGLVGYAWNPPAHLEPAPGTQKQLGALTGAWIESGAHCPVSETSKTGGN